MFRNQPIISRAAFPSSWGGVAAPKAQPGWSFRITLVLADHPVRSVKGGFAPSFGGRVFPSSRGGELRPLSCEPIALTMDRNDVLRVFRIVFNLLPQPGDMYIDGSRKRDGFI